jgi:predicted metalloprotease with PDZ domain
MLPTICYDVQLFDVNAHLLQITVTLPANAQQTILRLPNWIPGSYMIRDFAQHVHQEQARDSLDQALAWRKTSKHTWVVAPCAYDFTFSYMVFANDLSVRSAFINDQYAFFNGTSVFMQIIDDFDQKTQVLQDFGINDEREYAVRLFGNQYSLAHKWQVSTTLPVVLKEDIHPMQRSDSEYLLGHFQVNSYTNLIDHPIVIGAINVHSFMVEDVVFEMMFTEQVDLDMVALLDDMKKICVHHLHLFNSHTPIKRYVFQTLVCKDGFGGLEHQASTALLYPRDSLKNTAAAGISEGYETFLSLCAHELFHTWHVKRIKPNVMVNPSLTLENYTNQLWIYEGFTSFYDDATLVRTGIIPAQSYANILAKNITRLLRNPGRVDQSISRSSFEAWTKFYKQTPDSTNFIVSYYNKGGLAALCLDIVLLQQSNGQANLDTVMRLLWEHYGVDEVGTPDHVIELLCKQYLNINVESIVHQLAHSTIDLPLPTLLPTIGLRLTVRPAIDVNDKGGISKATPCPVAFGAMYSANPVGVKLTQVLIGSPVACAGMSRDDILIAMANYEVSQSNLINLLTRFTQQANVELTWLRDGRLCTGTMPIESALCDTAEVHVIDEAKFNAWAQRTLTFPE